MIAYLSHTLGGELAPGRGDFEQLSIRSDNVASAGRWFQFVVETTTWTVCWPWYPYITYLDWKWQDRCRRDQRRILHVSDVLVLTGIETSVHELDDVDEARLFRIPVLDLTDLARENAGDPPTLRGMSIDTARALIRRRCDVLGISP